MIVLVRLLIQMINKYQPSTINPKLHKYKRDKKKGKSHRNDFQEICKKNNLRKINFDKNGS